MERQVSRADSAGYTVERCRRVSRSTVACVITERGLPDDLDNFNGETFDLEYVLRATQRKARIKVWSPQILFG